MEEKEVLYDEEGNVDEGTPPQEGEIIDPNTGVRYEQVVADGYLRANLDNVYRNIKKDYDCFLVISGREGYGKSTLAAQIAKYLDPTYNLDRCTFTAEQFEAAVLSAKKYQAVVFDETMGYLGSRGAMSKFNRRLIKIMSEMRSRNLIVILCIPSFFELDKYPAMHRSTGLIHVPRRGTFQSFDYRKKKNIYVFGKKTYTITAPPSFYGSFTKYFPLPKQEYESKKQQAIAEWDKDNEKAANGVKVKLMMLIYYMHNELGKTHKEIADILECDRSHVSHLQLEYEQKYLDEGK